MCRHQNTFADHRIACRCESLEKPRRFETTWKVVKRTNLSSPGTRPDVNRANCVTRSKALGAQGCEPFPFSEVPQSLAPPYRRIRRVQVCFRRTRERCVR